MTDYKLMIFLKLFRRIKSKGNFQDFEDHSSHHVVQNFSQFKSSRVKEQNFSFVMFLFLNINAVKRLCKNSLKKKKKKKKTIGKNANKTEDGSFQRFLRLFTTPMIFPELFKKMKK